MSWAARNPVTAPSRTAITGAATPGPRPARPGVPRRDGGDRRAGRLRRRAGGGRGPWGASPPGRHRRRAAAAPRPGPPWPCWWRGRPSGGRRHRRQPSATETRHGPGKAGGGQGLGRPPGQPGAEDDGADQVGDAVGGAHGGQLGVAVGQRSAHAHEDGAEPGRAERHHRRGPALARGRSGPGRTAGRRRREAARRPGRPGRRR